ncbi:SDR family oxidoreductase [Haloglycomyces albus]|uniref:SDR family oxidoreductase n=1 Tax=Haloglycomyces albus TaxID=526067 RepID=UPI00046CEE53|nr:SDR family oxidoreductase [Haloglycomyces albus]
MDKTVLITGSNKGIGLATARELGSRGNNVILAARSQQRVHDAADALSREGINADPVELDVTDSTSVSAAVHHVTDTYGKLDVLINNAGIAMSDGSGNTSELTRDTMHRVFETNVYGVLTVTNAFLPLLHKSPGGQIINVSSEAGSLNVAGREDTPLADIQAGAYGTSKAALNMLTIAYAKELRSTPISVNAVSPGFTATDLNGRRGIRTVEEGSQAIVDLAVMENDVPNGTFRCDGRIDFLGDTVTVPW